MSADYDWVTAELLEEVCGVDVDPELTLRTIFAATGSPAFIRTIDSCLHGVKNVPLGNSPTVEHKLARTALLGGIQMGIRMALRKKGNP